MGILSATPFGVTGRVGHAPSSAQTTLLKNGAFAAGPVLLIFFLLPPVAHLASRYQYIQSLQFTMFAFVVPVLMVYGAPWRVVGQGPKRRGEYGVNRSLSLFFRIVFGTSKKHDDNDVKYRALILALMYLVLAILWRTAFFVDLLALHPLFDGVEAVSFLIFGVPLFLGLLESVPIDFKMHRIQRFITAAIIMWSTWIMAYFQGMSGRSWYDVYRNVVGRQISMSNDQQLATFEIWLVAAGVFLPIIFWNIVRWLQDEGHIGDAVHNPT